MSTGSSNKRAGFTFVEVMVTLVILSAGIVFIYKTFFLCVDYISRLSARMCATELIDSKIADVTRLVQANKGLSFSPEPLSVTQEINHRLIDFHYKIEMSEEIGFDALYRVKVGVSWIDSGRPTHYERSTVVGL